MKFKSQWTLNQKGIVALVMGIIMVAFLSVYSGIYLGATTVTEASTTVTETLYTTRTFSNVSSFTMTSIVIRTTSQLVTVTQTGPDQVQLSGSVTTRIPGTTPAQIVFASASGKGNFTAAVQDNKYSIMLKNQDAYNAFVDYKAITSGLANLGAGRCIAGGIVLYTLQSSLTTNWSC